MTDFDPVYVAARTVLLDALEALGPQRDAVVVVGAQAVYMRTGDADIAVAFYTKDADLALAPDELANEPLLEELLRGGDFVQEGRPGSWVKTVVMNGQRVAVPVDIMVPEGMASAAGRRGVRIPPHDKMVARKALGLEGAIIDNDRMEVVALSGSDARSFVVRVAGAAALVVAKLHKLHERLEEGKLDRVADKDAADVFRIMQSVSVGVLVPRFNEMLADPRSSEPTRSALTFLEKLFGAPRRQGVQMAIAALRRGVPAERVEVVCTSFTRQILDTLR